MTFEQWLEQNGTKIKDRWNEWCLYYVRYRSRFAADFRIPVPQFYLQAMIEQDPARGDKVLAYFKQQFEAGTPAQIPPAVPAPPGESLKSRVDQHTQASQSVGEAIRRGAAEGFKSEAKKSAKNMLGLLFRK